MVAYLGDGSGDGALTVADAAQADAIVGVNSTYNGQLYVTEGFAAYPNVDPAVVADTEGAGIVDGGAVAALAIVGAGGFEQAIPTPPKGANVLPTGTPDPDLSLPSQVTARGGVVSVPVMLDSAMPVGSTGLTEATLALTYDPHVLRVAAADVRLGSLPALGTGWTVTSVVDAAGGQLAIELYSPTPLDVAAAGSLVQVDFDVLPGAVGSTTVNLVGAVDPNGGRWFCTNLADTEGAMALGTSAAVVSVVALAQDDPSAQQRIDGLFTALGQGARLGRLNDPGTRRPNSDRRGAVGGEPCGICGTGSVAERWCVGRGVAGRQRMRTSPQVSGGYSTDRPKVQSDDQLRDLTLPSFAISRRRRPWSSPGASPGTRYR